MEKQKASGLAPTPENEAARNADWEKFINTQPPLDELPTDEQQIERVRELILEADSMDELGEDFQRNGVRKPLYFLQTFARESKQPAVEKAIALLREGMESTGTSALHYRKMRDAIELLSGSQHGD